jgi:hypothetical protein
MKPDVIAQTLQLEKDRAKMAEEAAAAGGGGGGGQIILQQPGQPPVTLNNQQVVQIIQKLQTDLEERTREVAVLQSQNSALKENYENLLMERLRAPIAPAVAPAAASTPTAEPVETAPTTTSADTETIFV